MLSNHCCDSTTVSQSDRGGCVEKKGVCLVLYDYDGLLSVCLFVVCDDVVKLLLENINIGQNKNNQWSIYNEKINNKLNFTHNGKNILVIDPNTKQIGLNKTPTKEMDISGNLEVSKTLKFFSFTMLITCKKK